MRYLVKLFFILSCFLTLQPANAGGPGTYTYYGFDTPGPFSNFDIYTTWVDAPASGVVNANIYPAFQFAFQNGVPGYMGIVLGYNGASRGVNFSIWDRDNNPATPPTATWNSATSPGCKSFDNEGTGVQCPLTNYNWVTGREYRLNVVSAGIDATGENWRGEITDTVTGVTTVMGVIHLANTPATPTTPSYAGYGRLTDGPLTFLEYYTASNCTGNPASKVLWRGPYAENELYKASYAYAHYNGCVNLNVTTSTGRPFSTHEIGDSVQHTTAEWQELWNSPVVATQPMTGGTPNCVALNATINTWGLASNLRFQYGATSAFGSTTANISVTSTTATPVVSTVCGLAASTTYYAQAIGTYNDPMKGALTTSGETLQFTLDASGNIVAGSVIAAPPVVSSPSWGVFNVQPVSNVQQTTATLSATVDTNGSAGRAYAQCKTGTGPYIGYGITPPTSLAQQSIKRRIISFDITGLTANTAYTCRIGAWNTGTTSDTLGTEQSFTTLAYPLPTATTGTASAVTQTSATLNGACNFNGTAGTAVFEYWKTKTPTTITTTTTQSFTASSNPYYPDWVITGLSSATNYAFRIKCTNVSGSSTGATSLTFKTAR